jgi:hypothetical protein
VIAGAPLTLAPANAGERSVGKPASTAEAGPDAPSATTGTVATSAAATATYLATIRRNTVGQSDRET